MTTQPRPTKVVRSRPRAARPLPAPRDKGWQDVARAAAASAGPAASQDRAAACARQPAARQTPSPPGCRSSPRGPARGRSGSPCGARPALSSDAACAAPSAAAGCAGADSFLRPAPGGKIRPEPPLVLPPSSGGEPALLPPGSINPLIMHLCPSVCNRSASFMNKSTNGAAARLRPPNLNYSPRVNPTENGKDAGRCISAQGVMVEVEPLHCAHYFQLSTIFNCQ